MTMWRYIPKHYGKIFSFIKDEIPKNAEPPKNCDLGHHDWIHQGSSDVILPGNVCWSGLACYKIRKGAERNGRISEEDQIYIFEMSQYKFVHPLTKTLSTEYLKGFFTLSNKPQYGWFVKKWLETVDEIESQQTYDELKKSLREKLIASWKR